MKLPDNRTIYDRLGDDFPPVVGDGFWCACSYVVAMVVVLAAAIYGVWSVM